MNLLLILSILFASIVLVAHYLLRKSRDTYQRVTTEVADSTEEKLQSLFIFADARKLFAGYVVAALLIPIALSSMGAGIPLIALALVVLAVLPRLLVRQLAKRRRETISALLPDALAQIAGSMRAGTNFTSALEVLIEEDRTPLGQEFGLLLREVRLGKRLEEALDNLGERVQSEEMDLVVSATLIALEIGGNLAEVLFRLSDTLRRKIEMEGKIRALSAQGVLQGRVITALPLFLMLALYQVEPEAIGPLFTSVLGWLWLVVIAIMLAVGAMSIHKIMRIDV